MGWLMFECIVLTEGDPANVAAFNYFFSLMMNMAVVFFVPLIVMKLVWSAGRN
jgi:hypothetical protein